jgi:hypothetical protein
MEAAVFPEVIAIPQLNIGIAFLNIISEGIIYQILILGEIVCPAIITTVAIAENDYARIIINRDSFSTLINLIEAFKSAHFRTRENHFRYPPCAKLIS